MSRPIISVEGLSKRYIIGHQAQKGDGLRHAIEQAVRAPFRWAQPRSARKGPKVTKEEFWALKDLNLEIQEGEVVGFVGRNGAGKSTLLKLLSRITEPTTGRIHLRGRVASLLEVGTGFHPELTGRENIFLNGAILGMTRVEIKRKFDEIVAFSEVERFLDTPVKRYSSGMYVRLAFGVAAHLEPEILIVDEVLAVGDAQFQKKCLDKMDEVGGTGRTVLFVSHNMQAVTRLCNRCVLLENGRMKMDGSAHAVAQAYINSGKVQANQSAWDNGSEAPGNHVVRLREVRAMTESGAVPEAFDIREPIGISIEYEVLESGHVLLPHFTVTNEEGIELFVSCDLDPEWRGKPRDRGRYVSTGWIPGNFLAEGAFTISPAMITLDPIEECFQVLDSMQIRVVDDLFATNTSRGDYSHPLRGVMRPMLDWSTRRGGNRSPEYHDSPETLEYAGSAVDSSVS